MAFVGAIAAAAISAAMAPSGPNSPSYYTPTDQAGMDQTYQNTVAQMQGNNPAANMAPQFAAQAGSIMNNPYANMAQTGANATGVQAYGAGNQEMANGRMLSGLAGNEATAGMQAYNTGFDPQGALYNQGLQQTNDQTNASAAARGIAMSPVGAGLQNQADNNYNIDWQNQQLGRQMQGLQAMNGANTTAGRLTQGAGMAGQNGGQLAMYGSSLPYQMYNTQANTNMGALQSVLGVQQQGLQNQQNIVNDASGYMGLGQGASQVGNNIYNTGMNYATQAQQGIGQMVGGGFGNNSWGGSNIWGGSPSGSSSYSNFQTPSSAGGNMNYMM